MYDAGNAKHVDAKSKRAKYDQRQLDEYLRQMLNTNVGRWWIFDLLGRCRISQSSFNSEPGRMAFDEGQRNIGLMLQADIARVYPEAFILMMREANDRDSSRDADSGGSAGNTSSGNSDADGDTTVG